jgi:hypothetical protein
MKKVTLINLIVVFFVIVTVRGELLAQSKRFVRNIPLDREAIRDSCPKDPHVLKRKCDNEEGDLKDTNEKLDFWKRVVDDHNAILIGVDCEGRSPRECIRILNDRRARDGIGPFQHYWVYGYGGAVYVPMTRRQFADHPQLEEMLKQSERAKDEMASNYGGGDLQRIYRKPRLYGEHVPEGQLEFWRGWAAKHSAFIDVCCKGESQTGGLIGEKPGPISPGTPSRGTQKSSAGMGRGEKAHRRGDY